MTWYDSGKGGGGCRSVHKNMFNALRGLLIYQKKVNPPQADINRKVL
jgi:hypothetical protein